MPAPARQTSGGFSYVEVLIATVIMAISLAPAMESLHTALSGSEIHLEAVADHYLVQGRLEEVLAEPISLLETAALAVNDETAPSSYSDPPNSIPRRLVFLSLYDGDNLDGDNDPFTGKDSGLVWVRVELQGTDQGQESLIARLHAQ